MIESDRKGITNMEKVNQPILIAQKSKGYVAMMWYHHYYSLWFFSFLIKEASNGRPIDLFCPLDRLFVYNTFIILLPKLNLRNGKKFCYHRSNKEQIIPLTK